MPGSMPEGKDFIRDFLLDKNIKRVLDVGPGSGNYFDLLSPLIQCEWVAVEIYQPYIDMFNLRYKYTTIIISDAYDLDWDSLGHFDVAILGDVIEHMEESRGREVIRQATEHATWVVLSLPIIDYPQGCEYGNIHETHVEQYSPDRVRSLLASYDLVDYREGEVIGAYIFRK